MSSVSVTHLTKRTTLRCKMFGHKMYHWSGGSTWLTYRCKRRGCLKSIRAPRSVSW